MSLHTGSLLFALGVLAAARGAATAPRVGAPCSAIDSAAVAHTEAYFDDLVTSQEPAQTSLRRSLDLSQMAQFATHYVIDSTTCQSARRAVAFHLPEPYRAIAALDLRPRPERLCGRSSGPRAARPASTGVPLRPALAVREHAGAVRGRVRRHRTLMAEARAQGLEQMPCTASCGPEASGRIGEGCSVESSDFIRMPKDTGWPSWSAVTASTSATNRPGRCVSG